jgi:pimeloyl-ACP methyl ester carboxylesterase
MNRTTYTLNVATIGEVEVTVAENGEGRTFLLLHGGAGPQSVAGFAELLAGTHAAHVVTPTHPGFALTPRPDRVDRVAALASVYVELLDQLGLHDVTVIGSSLGGWIAAEVALQDPSHLSALVLVDAGGIEVPGHPAADFFSLTLDQVVQLSFHNPDKFRIDLTTLPPAVREAMPGNRASLAAYGGATMSDPSLPARLGGITTPTLVVWGESDGIVDPDYGRAYAAAIPGATFHLLAAAGHLPPIETPAELLDVVWPFAEGRGD